MAAGTASCGSSAVHPRYVTGPTAMVQATTVGDLGPILVDGHGITLYMFTLDDHSGRSVCTSFCAAEWPPLLLPAGTTSPEAGPGIRRGLLGVTERAGGQWQETYAGWPLYTWTGDQQPGQATGQGVANAGGQWYVLRPSGQPEQ